MTRMLSNDKNIKVTKVIKKPSLLYFEGFPYFILFLFYVTLYSVCQAAKVIDRT